MFTATTRITTVRWAAAARHAFWPTARDGRSSGGLLGRDYGGSGGGGGTGGTGGKARQRFNLMNAPVLKHAAWGNLEVGLWPRPYTRRI